jgi:hypothetical protein
MAYNESLRLGFEYELPSRQFSSTCDGETEQDMEHTLDCYMGPFQRRWRCVLYSFWVGSFHVAEM